MSYVDRRISSILHIFLDHTLDPLHTRETSKEDICSLRKLGAKHNIGVLPPDVVMEITINGGWLRV